MSVMQEVIYETPDPVPTTGEPEIPAEEAFESDDIERIHLDVDSAFKRFAGRIITADNIDFSRFDNRLRTKGYRTGQYVVELIGPESTDPESLEDRYNRLCAEADDLAADVQANLDSEASQKVNISKAQLDNLVHQLKAINFHAKAGDKAEVVSVKAVEAPPAKPLSSSLVNAQLVAFERRLKSIENAVGINAFDTETAVTTPLAKALYDLRTRVDSLSPAFLEAAETRLNTLLAKNAAKQELSDTVASDVNKVFESVMRIDANQDFLISIGQRLRTLVVLHEQAADFASRLDDLRQTRTVTKAAIQGQKLMLEEFEKQFKAQLAEIRSALPK